MEAGQPGGRGRHVQHPSLTPSAHARSTCYTEGRSRRAARREGQARGSHLHDVAAGVALGEVAVGVGGAVPPLPDALALALPALGVAARAHPHQVVRREPHPLVHLEVLGHGRKLLSSQHRPLAATAGWPPDAHHATAMNDRQARRAAGAETPHDGGERAKQTLAAMRLLEWAVLRTVLLLADEHVVRGARPS